MTTNSILAGLPEQVRQLKVNVAGPFPLKGMYVSPQA